jgi:NADPH-dependent FMN reductase
VLATEAAREEFMLRIAIIIGSTRPGRKAEAVANWVYEIAQKRSDAEFELVDIKDFNLPLLDEPVPPIMGQYSQPHTKIWAAKMGSFDGYVSSRPSIIMASPARSRTRSIFFLPSGTTRRLASSVTAASAERGRSSSCVWC